MSEKNNILWLNVLRGIACAIVVATHIIGGKYVNGCGKIGVWCFMILSAYLLYRPYCHSNKDFTLHELRKFYLKRVARIFPTYLVALFFSYAIGYFSDIEEIAYHILGLHGIGHFWYMPVIIKFYAIMPIFLWAVSKLSMEKNIIFLLLIFVFTLIKYPFTEYIENSLELRWYLPVFILGMFLAIILSCKEDDCKHFFLYDVGVILCVGVGIMFTPYMREKIWGIEPSSWLQNKYLLYGILWSIIIVCISLGKYVKKILIKARILSQIGEVSFGIYLFHYPILAILSNGKVEIWMVRILTVMCSILLAYIVHFLVEKPLQRMIKSR